MGVHLLATTSNNSLPDSYKHMLLLKCPYVSTSLHYINWNHKEFLEQRFYFSKYIYHATTLKLSRP